MRDQSRQIRRASDYARRSAVWSRSDGVPGVFGQSMGQFRVRKGLRISMRVKTMIAGAALAALVAAPAAWAQDPAPTAEPVEGGTQVGGTVQSYMELILSQPATAGALASFPKAKTYSLSFDAKATATDAPTLLTLADGDVASGSKLGHLASGSKKLALPLEARVGSAAFQPLDATVDPLLTKWNQAMTRQDALVNLRQKVTGKVSGTYRKVILVTLSAQTP
jgi:hypothetical protein